MLADGIIPYGCMLFISLHNQLYFFTANYKGENLSVSAPGNPTVPVSTTNLNNKVDVWNGFSAGAAPRPTLSSVSSQVPSVRMIGHEGILHDHQPTEV